MTLFDWNIPWEHWSHGLPESPIIWAVAGGAAVLVVVWLVTFVKGRLASWKSRGRMHRAVRGEQRAVGLLEQSGWHVVDSQVSHAWMLRVGDTTVEIDLRADHIVRRAGQRWLAEVKTGRQAPSISNAATRRQLLEYHEAFDVDGILLVDIERETVQPVQFDV